MAGRDPGRRQERRRHAGGRRQPRAASPTSRTPSSSSGGLQSAKVKNGAGEFAELDDRQRHGGPRRRTAAGQRQRPQGQLRLRRQHGRGLPDHRGLLRDRLHQGQGRRQAGAAEVLPDLRGDRRPGLGRGRRLRAAAGRSSARSRRVAAPRSPASLPRVPDLNAATAAPGTPEAAVPLDPSDDRSASPTGGGSTPRRPRLLRPHRGAGLALVAIDRGHRRLPGRPGRPGAAGQHHQLLHHQGVPARGRRADASASRCSRSAPSSPAPSPWSSPCPSRWVSRSSSPSTPPAGSPGSSAGWSTCSPPSRRSSTASGAWPSSTRHLQRSTEALHDRLGWFPLFGDTGGRYSQVDPARRARAGDHGAADHRRALPRGAAPGARPPSPRRPSRSAPPAGRPIRTAVLPPSWPGIVSAIMLGLGRALGETIAVALVLGTSPAITARILGPGGNTIAANIAAKFGEYSHAGRGALIATGLVLFVITFAVNALARAIVIRVGPQAARMTPAPPTSTARHRTARRVIVRTGLVDRCPRVGRVPASRSSRWSASSAWSSSNGAGAFDVDFLTHSMRGIGPRDTNGGAYHAIIGTLEQVGLASLIAIPLGLLAAIYVVEHGRGPLVPRGPLRHRRHDRRARPSSPACSSSPSGCSRSARASAASPPPSPSRSSCCPTVVRTTEVVLGLVPDSLREARLALGVARWKTVVKVVLPTAASGITTGIVLAIARVTGETAPLLLTALNFDSHQHQPVQRPAGRPAQLRVRPGGAAAAVGHRPGLGRRAHAAAARPPAQPRRAAHRPPYPSEGLDPMAKRIVANDLSAYYGGLPRHRGGRRSPSSPRASPP